MIYLLSLSLKASWCEFIWTFQSRLPLFFSRNPTFHLGWSDLTSMLFLTLPPPFIWAVTPDTALNVVLEEAQESNYKWTCWNKTVGSDSALLASYLPSLSHNFLVFKRRIEWFLIQALLQASNELLYVKNLEQCLALSMHSIKVSYYYNSLWNHSLTIPHLSSLWTTLLFWLEFLIPHLHICMVRSLIWDRRLLLDTSYFSV